MPILTKLHKDYKKRGLVILAIDVQEDPATVREYAHKSKLPFTVLLDQEGRAAWDYGVRSHPAHFLIGPKGNVLGGALGAKDWSDKANRKLINYLIDKKSSGYIK